MKSIYNTTDNSELVQRINQLNPEQKPVGKNDVDQMLMHTMLLLKLLLEKRIKINFLMKLFGKMMKNKVFNSEFKKNSPTALNSFLKSRMILKVKKRIIKNIQLLQDGHKTLK